MREMGEGTDMFLEKPLAGRADWTHRVKMTPALPFVFLASVSPKDFEEITRTGPDLKQGAALLFGKRDTAAVDIPFVSVGEVK